MKILLLSACLFFAIFAQAWTINTALDFSSGRYTEQVSLFCSPGEALCQQVCKHQNQCIRQQSLCFNCLGVGQPLLRILFTEVDRLYQRSSLTLSSDELSNVFKSSHLFISARSIFNYFTNVEDPEMLIRFRSLCPSSSYDAVFVLPLKDSQPTEIKYLICKNKEYESEFYVVEYSAPKVHLP